MSARACVLLRTFLALLVFAPAVSAQPRKRPAQGGVTTPKGVTQPSVQPSAAAVTTRELLSQALSNVSARDAARTEILAQLAQRRPIAFVNGYWVTPIRVAAVVNNPTVAATLGARGGSQLQLDQLRTGFGLVFTPDLIARSVMKDMAQDITSSLAADALANNVTDGYFRGVAGAAWVTFGAPGASVESLVEGVGAAWGAINEAIGDALNLGEPDDPNTGLPIDDPGADPDGDGTPNRLDGDDDGDGTTDDEDDHPYDPGEDICGYCPGGRGIAFAARGSATQLRAVLNLYSAAQPLSNLNISLGTLADRPLGLVILR